MHKRNISTSAFHPYKEIFFDEYEEAKKIADSVINPAKKPQSIASEVDKFNLIIDGVNKRIEVFRYALNKILEIWLGRLKTV